MPCLLSILETALYVDDLDRASAFYEGVMGLKALYADSRMRAYDVNARSVLLLFMRDATAEPVETGGGVIPAHGAAGQIHITFAISPGELVAWRDALARHDIVIEGTSDWPLGGHSLYFRDPDGNMLELATTPGLWEGF